MTRPGARDRAAGRGWPDCVLAGTKPRKQTAPVCLWLKGVGPCARVYKEISIGGKELIDVFKN